MNSNAQRLLQEYFVNLIVSCEHKTNLVRLIETIFFK
jgi:hypothetical protein